MKSLINWKEAREFFTCSTFTDRCLMVVLWLLGFIAGAVSASIAWSGNVA
jgi:hypothetical protein